jgi:hypothetical protein
LLHSRNNGFLKLPIAKLPVSETAVWWNIRDLARKSYPLGEGAE